VVILSLQLSSPDQRLCRGGSISSVSSVSFSDSSKMRQAGGSGGNTGTNYLKCISSTCTAGRHLLVFELARFCQFVMIDCLVLSSRFVSHSLGPWVTIFCIQSKGWPFVVASWGLWSVILLHGDHEFQLHWLHFSGIAIYSSANSGSYILNSATYLRILLCMVLAGVLGTLKRTTVTLIFGRRMFGK
jgi:hypothetical protein